MGKVGLVCDCDVLHTEIVNKVKKCQLENNILVNIANFYKALSDNTRLKIIHALDISEMCVCDIAYLLNMTKSAISHQLKYLKHANIVKCRKNGKEVFYSLADDHVKQVFEISLQHVKESR